MNYYDMITIMLESTVYAFLMVKLFFLNPRINKFLIVLVIFLDYFFTTLVSIGALNPFFNNSIYFFILHSIFTFIYVYYFYMGSFINNLIKISLIKILYILSELPIFFLLTRITNIARENPKVISLYGSMESTFFTIFSLILFVSVVLLLDREFSEWVFSLRGRIQKVMFSTCVLIPMIIDSVINIQYYNGSYLINPFVLNILQMFIVIVSLITIVVLGLINKKNEYLLIEERMQFQNEKYKNIIRIEHKIAVLRHDISNLLECQDDKLINNVLEYCDYIEKEINRLDE